MYASLRWLKELCPVDADAVDIAHQLTQAGLEVEALHVKGTGLSDVVVAEVCAVQPHPKRDQLTLVTVLDGEVERQVVCGGSNVPEAGGLVLLARPGASLPNGMKIEPLKLGGVQSEGMLCSEVELDIGPEADEIVVLKSEYACQVGAPIVDALKLSDTILDIALTPNRPDCLGHIGIARELGLLFDVPFSLPSLVTPKQVFASRDWIAPGSTSIDLAPLWTDSPNLVEAATQSSPVSVEIKGGDRCFRYGAALVGGLTIEPSPFWLRYRLHNLGLRPISNVVDVTNLILLEWGHPVHSFDLKRLHGCQVVVRLAKEGETMRTLDDIERTFTSDDLLICDAEGPVGIAGVMGGAGSEIRSDTSDVLIECAYFNPSSVRRTARRLGLHTDSSHRFERGVDPEAVPRILARATALMAELGAGVAAEVAIDQIFRPFEPTEILFRPERATQLLGLPIDLENSRRVLSAIGCQSTVDDNSLSVRAPSWRPDLRREVDLIEEVARVKGYAAIPMVVPPIHVSISGTPLSLRWVEVLRRAAADAGLYEAVNYSFVSSDDLHKARVSEDVVALSNPLSEEHSVMRTSLLPGLIEAASRAQRHGVPEIALFELARTFHPNRELLPDEKSTFAIILAGQRQGWIGGARFFDFYDGKGVIEAVLDQVFRVKPDFQRAGIPTYLHPKRSAQVDFVGHAVGFVGELHPDVADDFDLSGRMVYAELDLTKLFGAAQHIEPAQASELPQFPPVARDIAMLVSEEIPAGEIASTMQQAADGLAESVRLFDLYRGAQVPHGQRSLAFRVTYRDPKGTLTDKRVDKVHVKLGRVVCKHFAATIR